jgi:hypothetical protein
LERSLGLGGSEAAVQISCNPKSEI